MRFKHEGITLWYGTPDAPAPAGSVSPDDDMTVTVAVRPVDAGNKVEIQYRANRERSIKKVNARWLWTDYHDNVQYFRAPLPTFRAADKVKYTVICHCAGRQVPTPTKSMIFPASFEVVEVNVLTPPNPKLVAAIPALEESPQRGELEGGMFAIPGTAELVEIPLVEAEAVEAETEVIGKQNDIPLRLYIGHLFGEYEITGFINDTDEIRLQGEVLLYGRVEGEEFIIEQLGRVALYGTILKSSAGEDRLGLISLAGPLGSVKLEPYERGQAAKVLFQVHYRELSKAGPRYDEGKIDVVFPKVEVLTATLSLTQARILSEEEVLLDIELYDSELTYEELGLIQTITVETTPILFRSPNSLLPLPDVYRELGLREDYCGDIPPSCDNGTWEPTAHLLPLKFINVSSKTEDELRTAWQEGVRGVCEVWWKKAALLVLTPVLDLGAPFNSDYNTIEFQEFSGPDDDQNKLPIDYNASIAPDSIDSPPHYVEIYLIDRLGGSGGGCTINPGQASAYCILSVNALLLPENKYLLAHEIGHVLGVDHPDGVFPDGSCYSVMDDSELNSINTDKNCEIFNDPHEGTPLNPIITTMGTMVCCQLDPDEPC